MMNTLTIKRPADTTATLISNEFIDTYMPRANGEFVKIYLYFLRYSLCPDSGVSLASAADTFCMTESDVLRALRYWSKEGLMSLISEAGQLTGIELCQPGQPMRQLQGNVSTMDTHGTMSRPGTEPTLRSAPASAQVPTGQAYTQASAGQPLSQTLAGQPYMQASAGQALAPTATGQESAAAPKQNMYNGVPAYTMEDIQNFKINNDGDQLFFVIQQYLGKPLGPTDINTIVFFSEQLHFPSDLIEYLFEYCVSNNHYSIHYIEKTAIAWANEGIDSVTKARAHCTYYNKTSFDILKAFGINNRNPAKSELEHIKRWTREYGFPMTLIQEAIRRTIEATHAPNFNYTESIMKKWYDGKVGSMDDVKKLDDEHEKRRQASENSATYVNSFAKKTASQTSGPTPSPANGSGSRNTSRGSRNKFHNFEQRTYDYNELEQSLLNKARKQADTPTGGN